MSRPYMPLYVADFLSATQHLDAPLTGAYILLIMHYWQKKGLPTDDRLLAMIAKMNGRQWTAAKPVLQSFFHDGWRHKRIDAEILKCDSKSSARASSGKRGGDAKALKNNNQPVAKARILPAVSASKEDGKPLPSSSGLGLEEDSQFSNENCSAAPIGARPQKSQGEPKTPRAILETVLSAELAAGVIEHRQRKRAPLTALAAKGLVREFVACRDPPAGALMMIERGWQAFKASWFFNEQEKLNLGGGNGFDRQNGSSRGGEEGLGFAALAVRRAREASQNRQ